MVTHTYIKRGKCPSCNQIIWTTAVGQGIVCGCSNSYIDIDGTLHNLTSVDDDEHKAAIKTELEISDSIDLINGSS